MPAQRPFKTATEFVHAFLGDTPPVAVARRARPPIAEPVSQRGVPVAKVVAPLPGRPPGRPPVAASDGGIVERMKQIAERASQGNAEARRRLQARDYAGAIAVIESLPERLRDVALLAEAQRGLAEDAPRWQRIAELEGQLRALERSGDLLGLRRIIEKLACLDPTRPEWRDAISHLPRPRRFRAGQIITNSIGMLLSGISEGEFVMGSPASEAERDSDETQHRVKISQPFLMSCHQVTQQLFQQVLNRNPSEFQKVLGQDDSRFPVQAVTWFDAIEFCNALSELEGLSCCYEL